MSAAAHPEPVEATVAWDPELLEALAPFHDPAAGRAALYRVAGRLLREPPDGEIVGSLFDRGLTAAVEDALGRDAADALRALHEPDEAMLAAAAEDFTALLKVSTGRFLKPWESVWRNKRVVNGEEKDGRLMGPCARAVAHFYEAAGADRDTVGYPELPDHLAVEFDFVGFLAEREARAFSDGRREAAASDLSLAVQFLDEHLLAWAPAVLAGMREKAETDLYRTAALLGSRLLESDDRLLDGARRALGRPKTASGR